MIVVHRLIWDAWNVAHIARHDVAPDEVEEVCHSKHVTRQGKKGRLLVVGPTKAKRVLIIVLDPEEDVGVYYPVTARPASRVERRRYKTTQGGEEAA